MSDEQSDIRDEPEAEVEGHKFVTDEPVDDESEKMKMRMKTKTKTQSSDELGDDLEGKMKY